MKKKRCPRQLGAFPKKIEGIDEISVLIINDGSTDATVKVAQSLGVNVLQLVGHQGLASAFKAGLNESIRLGADVIVNTDGDNQYVAEDMKKLIAPITQGTSDMVIGARKISDIKHFSLFKKILQKLGSAVVRSLSGIKVPDVTSGFRAYSRSTAMKLNVLSYFTYTLETIIHAGSLRLSITSVPIRVNPPTRKSRLFRNMVEYVFRSAVTILRSYFLYRPLKFLIPLSTLTVIAGLVPAFRYLYLLIFDASVGQHIQSLILSAILIITGSVIGLFAIMANLISANRKLLEELLYLNKNK